MSASDLPASWRERASGLERFAPSAAEAFRMAADELEEAERNASDEELTLAQAFAESGVPERTLREHIAKGKIPNAGRKHAPRIRRGDLPKRPRGGGGGWDPGAHVAAITGGAR